MSPSHRTATISRALCVPVHHRTTTRTYDPKTDPIRGKLGDDCVRSTSDITHELCGGGANRTADIVSSCQHTPRGNMRRIHHARNASCLCHNDHIYEASRVVEHSAVYVCTASARTAAHKSSIKRFGGGNVKSCAFGYSRCCNSIALAASTTA